MTDIAKLVVALEAETARFEKQLGKANKTISRFEKTNNKRVNKLRAGFLRLAGSVGSLATASAGLRKLVSVARETDILNAQLITATGSTAGAAAAFEQLEKFAAKTPFALNQSVVAFQKLVNLGLTPSERALTSYGNTASALGKDLNQFIEAVADAATNEFERLKEFGIKAKQQGDQVSLTFQGITTTIGKNAAEIEQYLIDIGETQFAGAMEQRAKTLDGAISNLGDAWDGLFRTISSSGVGNAIAEQMRTASNAIIGFSKVIKTFFPGGQIGQITADQSELGVIAAQLERLQKAQGFSGRNKRRQAEEEINKLLERQAFLTQRIVLIRQQAAGAPTDLGAFGLDPDASVGGAGGDKKGFEQSEINTALAEYNSRLLELAANAPTTAQRIADMYSVSMNKLAESTEQQRETLERAKANFDDVFTQNLVQAAEGSFDSILDSWAKTLQQMAAKAISSKIFELFAGIGGGGAGSFGGAFAKLFGGGRASGGSVSRGKFYEVGERGPELFAPGMNGTIIPNGAMGGTVINVNAPNSDAGVIPRIEAAVARAVSLAAQNRLESKRRGQ